ncbi:MAG: hypothetical protein E7363_05270 [Clostridiales bacterium]|nr:hypothetical protein [Clostridiales bacterium]
MRKLFCFACLCIAAVFLLYPLPCHAKAGFRLYFYEAGSDFPVNEVHVIIPEKKLLFTLNSGDVLPVERAHESVTLLIFKEGYADTAVFGFPLSGKEYAKYALYRTCESLPYVAYAETPCEKDILSLFNAYREWVT